MRQYMTISDATTNEDNGINKLGLLLTCLLIKFLLDANGSIRLDVKLMVLLGG